MSRPEPPIDVFLSYKREDREAAGALAEALARRGYSVWWDVDLLPGDRFADAILAVIKRAGATVVLWSEASVASGFVRAEASAADGLGRLIPTRIDDCELPLPFNVLHTHDLRPWRSDGDEARLQPLFLAIEGRCGQAPSAPQPAREADQNLHVRDHEALLWRSIIDQPAPAAEEYELYLGKYPDGMFAELARLRLERILPSEPEPPERKAPGPERTVPVLPEPGALVFHLWPRLSGKVGRSALALVGAILLAASGNEVVLPGPVVLLLPIMLASTIGGTCGFRTALVAVVVYTALCIVGLPVFPWSLATGSLEREFVSRGGSYVVAALGTATLLGFLADKGWLRTIHSTLVAFILAALTLVALAEATNLIIGGRVSKEFGSIVVLIFTLPVGIAVFGTFLAWRARLRRA